MATTMASDPTFRSYSAEEAKYYGVERGSYSPNIYELILKHHASTGGTFGLLLDCGCGPGNATRDIAQFFDQAIGTDPGQAMIKAAKDLGGKTKSGADIDFAVSGAEDLSQVEGLKPQSVDLLTAAMAAHWFDMPKFWAEADKIVKPGGTVALWTLASSFCHPSTPNYKEVQKIILRLERETLAPYALPGNHLSMNMYDTLPLPWDVSPPSVAFPKCDFVRHEFDREGKLSNGTSFFGGSDITTLDEIENSMSSASMVTRWRAAHPELVGTERDVLRVFVTQLREALGGQDFVERGNGTAILLFQKSTAL